MDFDPHPGRRRLMIMQIPFENEGVPITERMKEAAAKRIESIVTLPPAEQTTAVANLALTLAWYESQVDPTRALDEAIEKVLDLAEERCEHREGPAYGTSGPEAEAVAKVMARVGRLPVWSPEAKDMLVKAEAHAEAEAAKRRAKR